MVTRTKSASKLKVDRRVHTDGAADRRQEDRRKNEEGEHEGLERRQAPRRKVERRRQIDPTTCERDYGDAEIEFMKAMDEYKRRSGRQFPTWSEVLEVLHSLGYRQVAETTEVTM
ncbi:MAG: hypothetical protein CMJ48_04390 [Planctomycetaceae bacterium]|nr:hypothetical protein [Planctomycetaceae bacterium]